MVVSDHARRHAQVREVQVLKLLRFYDGDFGLGLATLHILRGSQADFTFVQGCSLGLFRIGLNAFARTVVVMSIFNRLVGYFEAVATGLPVADDWDFVGGLQSPMSIANRVQKRC